MVAVVWEDIRVLDNDSPWVENKPRDYVPHLVRQVGFIVKDVPEGIHLVSAWHPELTNPPDQIPRGAIRSITPLQPAPEPKKRRR